MSPAIEQSGDKSTSQNNMCDDISNHETKLNGSEIMKVDSSVEPKELQQNNEEMQPNERMPNLIRVNPAPDPLNIGTNSSEEQLLMDSSTKVKQENGGISLISLVDYDVYSDESDCEMVDAQEYISELPMVNIKEEPDVENEIVELALPIEIKEEPPDKPVKNVSVVNVSAAKSKHNKLRTEVAKLYTIYQRTDFQIPNPDDSDGEEVSNNIEYYSDTDDSEDEIIIAGPYREPVTILLSSDSEEDEESESESSSSEESESSSESEDEIKKIDTEEIKKIDNVVKPSEKPCAPVTKKREVVDKDSLSYKLGFNGMLPNIEDLHISIKEEEAKAIGLIDNIIDVQVIVRAYPSTPAINLDSVLFLDEGKRTLGKVFDVFGRVNEPHYVVRFNSEEHVKANNIEKGLEVFFAPQSDHTKYVLLDDLMKQKYSDRHDFALKYTPGLDENELDFSDDEEEKRYYQELSKEDHSLPTKKGKKSYRNPFQDVDVLPNYQSDHYNDKKPFKKFDKRNKFSGHHDSMVWGERNQNPSRNGRQWQNNDNEVELLWNNGPPDRKIQSSVWNTHGAQLNRPPPSFSPMNNHTFGQPTAIGNNSQCTLMQNLQMPPPPCPSPTPSPTPFIDLTTNGSYTGASQNLFDRSRLPPNLHPKSSRNALMCMPPPPIMSTSQSIFKPPSMSLLAPSHFNAPPPSISPSLSNHPPQHMMGQVPQPPLHNIPPPDISPCHAPHNLHSAPPTLCNIPPPVISNSHPSMIGSTHMLPNGFPNTVPLHVSNMAPITGNSNINMQSADPWESLSVDPSNLLTRSNPWDAISSIQNNAGLPNPWSAPPNF